MKNTLFALLSFILLSAPLTATAQQFGDFTYSSNGLAITITGYTGPGGAVTIPSTINGLPVVTIGNNVFNGQITLTSVAIPNSVTNIGNYAFYLCRSLASVTIPDGVTSVGSYAFSGCTSLNGVTIGTSLNGIGDQAFSFCTSLTAITVDTGNSFLSDVDGVLFNKSHDALIVYPGGRTGSYTIPNSVTFISNSAFYGCTLTYLTIPGSIFYVGEYAFAFCTNLQGIFFKGNPPPIIDESAIFFADNVVFYYLPGATGWDTFGGPPPPTLLWNPLMQSVSIGPSGFGFNITGTADIPIVIEAATDLANATWFPLQSLNLTNGAFYFSDPDWTNYPARFYRIRSP
jgi:hypothetical protein